MASNYLFNISLTKKNDRKDSVITIMSKIKKTNIC